MWMSVPQMPAATTSSTTCPAVATGSGRRCRRRVPASSGRAQELFDFGERRHLVGAPEARRDDCSRRIREAQQLLELPTCEQPMTERSAERVAGAEPVDHLDLDGWHDDCLA